jgi:hypothetical protein
VAPDYVAWSLTGETELLGEVAVLFQWEEKISELEVGKSVDIQLPWLQPRDVDRAWGQIVLTKAETLDVRAPRELTGLRPIDPQQDLMRGIRIDGAARAFEFYEDWDLTITATRYQLEEVKRTSIERAVVRMEVTRSNVVSVQALYRMRSARQRLAITLPEDVAFDTEPLRLNGRTVSLERGDKEEYYVPLVGQNAEEPFLLELRFTTKGDHRRLDLPQFPSEPAVQKVYLCCYLPRELAFLGAKGPWTDEMAWRWYETLEGRPVSPKSDRELVDWVIQGLHVANPFEDFATDGQLYTFSTLRPAQPPGGSLRLAAMNRNWLSFLVFAIVAVIGLLLVPRPISHKFAALAGMVAGLVVAGVFLPTFSRQIMDGAMLSAIVLVLAVWLMWHAIRSWPHVTAWFAQRMQRRPVAAEAASGEQPEASTPDNAHPPSPADPASPSRETGSGEPPVEPGEPDGQAEQKGRPQADEEEPSEEQEKGGTSDA